MVIPENFTMRATNADLGDIVDLESLDRPQK